MVVGKTNPTISKNEIFTRFSEAEVLSTFLNIREIPCCISSPLREDRTPSFQIYMNKEGHVKYLDYATDEKGGVIDLLMQLWHCSFSQALDRICGSLMGHDSPNGPNVTFKPKHVRTFTRREHDELTSIQVAVRPWKDSDYEYWRNYGIEPKWLRYAEVYPISHKIVTKRASMTDKGRRYVFFADPLAFVFVEHKEGKTQLKIYQPYNTKGFKWCSKMDSSVISLWGKIPEYGDRVVICSSLKDSLCLSSQLHIPAIAPQGEGYDMSDTAINELKRRYKRVYICFDTDKAGIADGEKLAQRTGFINVVPDLGKEKDISDYYRSLSDKEDFKQLEKYFNQQ